MSDKKETSPALKRSWFQELKTEFGKITWPNRKSVTKQSVAVIIAAIVLGFIIAGVDYLLSIGLSFILI
jgi:preprotein translocase subunit SecE